MIGTLGPTTFDEQNILNPSIVTMASAATINPISNSSRITGNVTISTILQPTPYFNGPMYLFNTDAAVGVWDTAGNIALGGTFTRFKVFAFLFDATTNKWYPSAVS